jgi:hypothetical protein
MEHDEAVGSQAAERYVAHELSPAEQEAFEEHFFDCPQCADEVRFEMTFAANARAALREQRIAPAAAPAPQAAQSWRNRLAWLRPSPTLAFSFAANFALAAGLGYVLLTGGREMAVPQFTQPYFAPGVTHGEENAHAIPPGANFYQVRFGAPAGQSYSYEILDAAGKRESSGSKAAPASEEKDLYFVVPLRNLPAGVHTLVVRAGAGGEIVSWSQFRIRVEGR